MPIVSVIIPTFNRRHYIADAIDSVFRQTFRDMEVIIVDDGSTDGSGELIKNRYGDSVLYKRQENSGRSVARNVGMEMASGQFIAFLDSDDIWVPDKLHRQMAVFEKRPDVGFVHTLSAVIDQKGNWDHAQTSLRRRLYQKAIKRGYTYVEMSRRCTMFLSTVVVRRSCLEQIGQFDPQIQALEDWEWYLRASLVTRIETVPEELVLYRMHSSNTTMHEFMKGRVQTSLKHLQLLETDVPIEFRKKARVNFYKQLAMAYYQLREMGECGLWMKRAISLDPLALLDPSSFRHTLALCLPSLLKLLRKAKARLAGPTL